ncbi:Methylaspartate mutase S chain [Budvicia aquatica]|uniref:Methylaspartate mutase S chain n=1 Tax=Budvicia aquatica TaxID=82979 RepID=A0A484ZLD2_9GAMM|nr:Methylaspartate mutase S chain [Budvicia aquatica]
MRPLKTGAHAIIVSSIYGHGDIDCMGMRERCIERGIGDIPMYVGGNLVIGKHDFSEIETKFKAMGFNRVFSPDTDLELVCSLMKSDIEQALHAEPVAEAVQ